MEFKHYDSRALVAELIKRGVDNFNYVVCQGCVFTDVMPEYCVHREIEMKSGSVQSEKMCPHCLITIEESQEPFHLHMDKDLTDKVKELEEMVERAKKQ